MDIAWVRGSNEDDTEGWLQSQFFPACAQIEIASENQGPLPKGFHIPEDVPHMPGMKWSLDMDQGKRVDKGYIYPMGPLWDGKNLLEDRAQAA
jgi:hypothetical protein